MKKLFIFLLLLPFIAAGNVSQNLAALNSSQTLFVNYSECATVFFNQTNLTSQNLTVCFGKANIFAQLDYGDCYRFADNVTRAFCIAATPPNVVYLNESIKVTVIAPPFPQINANITVGANEVNDTFKEIWGLRVKGANQTRYGIRDLNVTLANATCYADNESNVSFCSKQFRHDQTVKLYGGQNISHQETNLSVSCEFSKVFNTNGTLIDANLDQMAAKNGFYCFRDASKTNCTRYIGVLIENKTQNVCYDNIRTFCTGDEIVDGRLVECFERYTQTQRFQIDSLTNVTALKEQQLFDTRQDLEGYRGRQKIEETGYDWLTNNLNILFAVGFLVTLLIVGATLYVHFNASRPKIHHETRREGD